MKALICFILFFSCQMSAEEPAIEALMADSPVIVVATPVFENGRPPLGRGSEVVLVKYWMKFRILKVLKSNQEMKPGDLVLTHLAVHMEGPGENTFQLKEGQPKILFLRKTSDKTDSFENTSIWFGVMPHSKTKELELELECKRATANRSQ